MITDKIENIKQYENLSKNIKEGLELISNTDFSNMKPGKYDLKGEDIFYLVNEYKTKDKEEIESEVHRKYIDIQFMVSGEESIGYAPFENQEETTEYDSESDISFFKVEVTKVPMKPNQFAIFFPSDIHAPGLAYKKEMNVKKIVVKVKA